MAWKGRKAEQQGFSDLLAPLASSRIQQTNPALWQVISQIIGRSNQNREQIIQNITEVINSTLTFEDISVVIQEDISAIKQIQFILNEPTPSGLLNNARQLTEGENITLDDTTPGEVEVSSEVTVDPAGALNGNGQSATPLAVRVDGATVIINASNELEAVAAGGGITQLTGDVTAGPGSGSQVATIPNDTVTNAKLANMTAPAIKGRTTAGAGDPEDLTPTQTTALLDNFVGDSGAGGTKGLVPAPVAGDATKFLKGDATWATVTGGTGDVTAAANLDDNTIIRGDGGVKGVQDSGITIDDSNNVTGAASLAIGGSLVGNTKLTVQGQLNIVPSNHSAAGASEAIDFAVSNEHTVILDETCTFTLSNPVDGGRYIIILIQDGSGGNNVVWPASVRWPGGTTPTITSGANKADLVTLYYISSLSIYLASINQDYTTT